MDWAKSMENKNENAEQTLRGARILVAEDDAILAFDLGIALRKAGALIIGPALTLAHTLALVQSARLSAAVLDVSLRDEDVFPAAEALRKQGVGIIFYTGHAAVEQLRRDWPDALVLPKPAPARLLVATVQQALCAAENNGGSS